MTPAAVKDRILRRMPAYIREGIEEQDGIVAAAAVFSRLHGRIDQETRSAGLIEEAAGAARAETTATVTWPDLGIGAAVAVPAGQIVAKTAWGVEFALSEALEAALPSITWLGGYLDCDGVVTALAAGALTDIDDGSIDWTLIAVVARPATNTKSVAGSAIVDIRSGNFGGWTFYAYRGSSGTSVSVSGSTPRALATITDWGAGNVEALISDGTTSSHAFSAANAADLGIASGFLGPVTVPVYAVLALSGTPSAAELLAIEPVESGGGGLAPWDVWSASRILRCYLPHLARVDGSDVIIPDVAEALGGGIGDGGVDAIMSGGGLERIVNTSGDTWPLPSPSTVTLEALWAGIEGNVPGWAIVWTDPEDWAGWTGDPDDIALVKAALAAGSVTLEASDSAGGVTGWLDLHAADRGLPRAVDEEDPALRRRLRALPEIVTPHDIEESAKRLVQPFNATARVSEWWEHAFTWGVSGWGVDAWVRMRSGVVLVRAIEPGDDMSGAIAAVENYLSRGRPFGVWVEVLEETP